MIRLNSHLYPEVIPLEIDENDSLSSLSNNNDYASFHRELTKQYGFSDLRSFSFSADGVLALLCELKGSIAVSLGECDAIIEGAKKYRSLGFEVDFIGLHKDGTLALNDTRYDWMFISNYTMDTFVKNSLADINAKIIANISISQENLENINIALLDAYKLTGFFSHGLILHNGLLQEQTLAYIDYLGMKTMYQALKRQDFCSDVKAAFIQALEEEFKDELLFFVTPEKTHASILHFGLRGIKAREMIRTLALHGIYITNGEGCSLGLSRPSKIIQAMGYSEEESRQCFSISFTKSLTHAEIKNIVQLMGKKYRQIRMLNG